MTFKEKEAQEIGAFIEIQQNGAHILLSKV